MALNADPVWKDTDTMSARRNEPDTFNEHHVSTYRKGNDIQQFGSIREPYFQSVLLPPMCLHKQCIESKNKIKMMIKSLDEIE